MGEVGSGKWEVRALLLTVETKVAGISDQKTIKKYTISPNDAKTRRLGC